MNIKLLSIVLLVFFTNVSLAQEDYLKKLKGYDLSQVINPDSLTDDMSEKYKHPEPLGFIGDDFQRFQVHFTSFTKSKSDPLLYNVKGKTRVKDNICNFIGTVKLVSAEEDEFSIIDVTDPPGYHAVSILADVEILEDKSQKGAGKIEGTLLIDVFFDDKGVLRYNALMWGADGFRNNQFTGKWTSYKNGTSKKCNWGDFRIPESKGLDMGAGEFSVAEKYKQNGWQSYYDAYCCDPDKPETKAARKKEEQWWL
jgi:hypothetical protein